jgi:nucleotide-binding universal stress UspA family protein
MPAIKHILFPYDFSKQGSSAAPFVGAIARRFGARITLLGVVPPIWNTPPEGMPALVRLESPEMERGLQSRLDQALTGEFTGLQVERETDSGDPALSILAFAQHNGVDLIMMPTHGVGVFRSLLLGSVTAKVLHDARCPVWTAAHAEEQHSPAEPRTILCAVDGSDKTPALLRWAAEFSRQMGGDLRLLHVVHPISDWLALASERELQEEVRAEASKQLESLQQAAGVSGPLRVAVGKIAETVTEEARQEGADLVLIGRGMLPSALGRLRTHAYGIIQRSPCPVLSV